MRASWLPISFGSHTVCWASSPGTLGSSRIKACPNEQQNIHPSARLCRLIWVRWSLVFINTRTNFQNVRFWMVLNPYIPSNQKLSVIYCLFIFSLWKCWLYGITIDSDESTHPGSPDLGLYRLPMHNTGH